MINCPNKISIVINSLISSNDAPGVIIGKGKIKTKIEKFYYHLFKASDGINEYVAISSNGGRLWRLVNILVKLF